MKNTLLFIFLILCFAISFSQNTYYYYKGEKQYLTIDNSKINITTTADFSKENINQPRIKTLNIKNNKEIASRKFGYISFDDSLSNEQYSQFVNSIKENGNIIAVHPNYITVLGDSIGMSAYFYVKLKNIADTVLLNQHAIYKNVIIFEQNQFMPLWFTLICTNQTQDNTLEVANYFFETGYFASSVPDFLSDDRLCTNDPNFSNQWGLNNSSHLGIDINICSAWDISTGYGVKVTVLDTGIELTHSDLSNNISSLSYDSETNTSPSQVFDSHGTHCAGIIGAIRNNNNNIAGVAPNTTLMSVSNSLMGNENSRIKRADGINWALQNGTDVISNSWNSSVYYELIDDAIDNAFIYGRDGKGCIIVFASANYGSEIVGWYPANCNSNIITVGAIRSIGRRPGFSNYGEKLDIVAPGEFIISTVQGDSLDIMSGTSAACPHVAGVAALILSVNPNLTVKDVQDIIEQTAQKTNAPAYTGLVDYVYSQHNGRPNGTWNNEMGYGLVDAYAAVLKAQQLYSSTLDLYIKDRPEDLGISGGYHYLLARDSSPDIWVRNQPDGFSNFEHQNPEYDPNLPVYVYVRVRNKSSVPSTGTEEIAVYWSKAASWQSWPQNWDGTDPSIGNLIGRVSIGTILPGHEQIYEIPWYISNTFTVNWNQCVLSRIENSASDPITIYPGRIDDDVYFNNNVSWRNCHIVNFIPNTTLNSCGGIMYIGNFSNQNIIMNWQLSESQLKGENSFLKGGEITITFDSIGWNAMNQYFRNNKDIEITGSRKIKIISDNVKIDSISYPANAHYPILVEFNAIASKSGKEESFKYNIVEYLIDSSGTHLLGGMHYTLNKPDGVSFKAITDKEIRVNFGDPVTLNATQQSQPNLVYNWYDQNHNLIGSGTSLSFTPTETEVLMLEVISADYCYRDYANVLITVNPNYIRLISPNPATNTITIDYHLSTNVTTAQIKITNQLGTIGSTYNIGTSVTSFTTNISSLPVGTYTVSLICDGNIKDSKNFIKQ
ncbi:MAG: S8 family peptidase [Bacteroidales bacterium]|jgi:subtilisin family serine protease|nr:S8 family peptidase [Bacteroidales bacterium]